MIISLIADPHLNKTVYKGVYDEQYTDLPFRNADFMRSFEFMVNKNIDEIHPDLIVVLGDVYDTFEPSNPIRTFLNSQLKKLSDVGIPTILLVGNHDICSKHHALKPISVLGLKNIKVIESPMLVPFKDKLLMLFPFSLEVEKGEIEIKDQLHKFIEYTQKQIELKPESKDKEILFFGHFGVSGAVKNSYDDSSLGMVIESSKKEKKKVFNTSSEDISLADLDATGAKYVFLGDYHQHQVLDTKKTIAFYVGSIEKGDFSEKDHKKGFVVYDSNKPTNGKLGCCTFIEYPKCRPMIELKGTYDTMLKDIELYPPSEGILLKLYFVGNEDELLEYSVKLEILKQKLQAKFKPIYLYSQQKITNEKEEEIASQIENDIIGSGHIDDNDVKQVVEETIKEKEKDIEEQKILVEMAEAIYKETKEGA